MPLFTVELNELADRIGRSNLTIRLHTAAPTNGKPHERAHHGWGRVFWDRGNAHSDQHLGCI